MSSFSLTPVEITRRGDLAYVYGRNSWVMTPPGAAPQPDSGKYLVIWRKQADGGWKITRDMFNSDLAPGASAAEAK